jgi:hypothetical protein
VRSEKRIFLKITVQKIQLFSAHTLTHINVTVSAFNGNEIYYAIEENNRCVTDEILAECQKIFIIIIIIIIIIICGNQTRSEVCYTQSYL